MANQKQQPSTGFTAFWERLSQPEPEPVPWNFLDMTNALAAVLICIMLIGSTAAILVFGSETTNTTFLFGWNVGCFLTALFVIVSRRANEENREAMRLQGGSNLPFLMMLGIAAAATVSLSASILSGAISVAPELLLLAPDLEPTALEWGMAIVFMIGMQPLADELVFRGVVLPKLRRTLGPWAGVSITSVTYAILHYLIYGSYFNTEGLFWYSLMAPLLMSVFYCGVRVYTNSTRAAIIVHSGAGLFAILTAMVLYMGR